MATVDQKVTDRLRELVVAGESLLATRRSPPPNVIGDDRIDQQLAAQWITSVESLLARVFGEESAHYRNFSKHVERYVGYSDAKRAHGVLKAPVEDYSGGYLFEVKELVEAEMFHDFLDQAEHLLDSGYFQAAAVIAGCVLEDGMRKLCVRNGVALPAKPKLDQMNSDLAKAGVYSKLIQKRITTLAHIRNQAAHGQWDQFTSADVEDMMNHVRRFMEDFWA